MKALQSLKKKNDCDKQYRWSTNSWGIWSIPKKIHEEMLIPRDEIFGYKGWRPSRTLWANDHLNHIMDKIEKSQKRDQSRFSILCTYETVGKWVERDVFLGKSTMLDHGLNIVDWRHAPISKIFCQYQEGEDYEEKIAGRDGEESNRSTNIFIQGSKGGLATTTVLVKTIKTGDECLKSMMLAGEGCTSCREYIGRTGAVRSSVQVSYFPI